MLNNVKVGVKLIVGFLIVAAIAGAIGIMGITSVSELDEYNDELYERRLVMLSEIDGIALDVALMRLVVRTVQSADDKELGLQIKRLEDAKSDFLERMRDIDTLITSEASRKEYRELEAAYKDYLKDIQVVIDSTPKYRVELPPEYAALLDNTRASAAAVTKHSNAIVEQSQNLAKKLWEESSHTAHGIRKMLIALVIAGVVIGVALGYYLSTSISGPLAKTVNMLNDLRHGHLGIRLRMTRRDEIGTMASEMDTFADDLQNVVVGTMKQIAAGDLSAEIDPHDPQDEIGPALKGTIEALRGLIIEDGGKVLQNAAEKDLSQRLTREYRGEYARMKENINTLVQNLDEAMAQVSEAVSQVTSASGQISQGSQSLAEGANTQASSLEEVSSSLEEMSSMTKQNADNANDGKAMVASAAESLGEADNAMKRMSGAIQAIKVSSDNTSKILKTIDDIAFQTNLLALNAAVEAARAGEAGKGFAVVAEEVRNLAMRSAEASKNTATMIEESVKSAEEGVSITEDVAKYLRVTVERAGKVANIIAEIAAASNEQAQGIEQVNTAMAQMNQVTQQNAANSEESASAAEELNGQAAELSNMVGTFSLSSSDGCRPQSGRRRLSAPKTRVHTIPYRGSNTGSITALASGSATQTMKSIGAEEIIPLDDSELVEF